MIIDRIVERQNGGAYSPMDILAYTKNVSNLKYLQDAFLGLDESVARKALCRYIDSWGKELKRPDEIKKYIMSVDWIYPSKSESINIRNRAVRNESAVRSLVESVLSGKKSIKEKWTIDNDFYTHALIRDRIESRFGKGSEWYSSDLADWMMDNIFYDGTSLDPLDEYIYNISLIEEDNAEYEALKNYHMEYGAAEPIPAEVSQNWAGHLVGGMFESHGRLILVIESA